MPRSTQLFLQNAVVDHNPIQTLAFDPTNIVQGAASYMQLPTPVQLLQEIITGWINMLREAPEIAEQLINEILTEIDNVTGLDLVGFAQALESLFGDVDLLSALLNLIETGAGGVINDLINMFVGAGTTLAGLTGLGSIITDLETVIGDPIGLGTGTPAVVLLGTDIVNGIGSFVDALVRGLQGLVEGIGFSIADVGNAASQIFAGLTSVTAISQSNSTSISNQAITTPLSDPTDPTCSGVFNLMVFNGTAPTYVPVTVGASAVGMIYTMNGGVKESLVFWGYFTSGVTGIFLDVSQVNAATGVETLLWSSSNVISDVPSGLTRNVIALPSTDYISSGQGDWYAAELQIEGPGTYYLVGIPGHWMTANTSGYPSQLGATRAAALTVSHDATGAGYTKITSASSVAGSFTHTATAGVPVLLAVTVITTASASYTGYTRKATYGSTDGTTNTGSPMASLGAINAGNSTDGWIEFFGITGVAAGTSTIAFSVTGGSATFYCVAAGSSSYLNSSGFGTAVTNYGTSTSLTSGSVTSNANQMVAQCFLSDNTGGANTTINPSTYTQTVRYSENLAQGTSYYLAMVFGDAPGASSVSFAATCSSGSYFASIAVPVLPAHVPPPSSISSPVYSQNVPWFGLSGGATPSQITPETTIFTKSGTYQVPTWMIEGDLFDFVIVPDGGGGGGAGLLTPGYGGDAGTWLTLTLTLGVAGGVPLSTSTFTLSVGGGGAGGAGWLLGPNGYSGLSGAGVTITVPGYGSINAPGGTGGLSGASSYVPGQSPGNTTYQSILYTGGATQPGYGVAGNAPGGGGGPGGGTGGAGGAGAPACVWITARRQ